MDESLCNGKHHFTFVRWLSEPYESPNTNEAYAKGDRNREGLWICEVCGKELRQFVTV